MTFYANVANVKITDNEVIFEFGAAFPATNQPESGKPNEFVPDARIVMGLSAVKAFADILQKAVAHLQTVADAPQHDSPDNRPEPNQ